MNRRWARAVLATIATLLAVSTLAAVPAAAQGDPTTSTTTTATGSTGSGSTSGSGSKTTGAPETPSPDDAIDDLVGCVQGSSRLLVLFLIDESASLQLTDPENRRVDAARSALDSIVALASTEGAAAPKIDVALAAFSNEYRLVQDWTPAGAATAAQLDTSLGKFASFNHGIDTDFVNALSSGREALADKAAEVSADRGAKPCRAVMLFTDGGFDIAVRASAKDQKRLGTTKPYAPGIQLTTKANVIKAEAAGRKALCRSGGLADRLRNDDVTLLTVALSGDVARRAQLPLAAATAGVADDYPCGTKAERSPGAYLPAAGVDTLVVRFNEVGTRLAGGNLLPGEDQVPVCGKDACDEGTRKFTLDDSLRRAQIVALAPKPGAVVVLKSPGDAKANVVKAGTGKVGSVEFTARDIAGRGLAIDIDRPSGSNEWEGEWTATIIDPSEKQDGKKATLQIFLFSDIDIQLSNIDRLERGADAKVQAKLKAPKGVKLGQIVALVEAEARFRNPVTGALTTVPLTGEPTGTVQGTFRPASTITSNVLEASIQARITTRSGAVLVAQSPTTELVVRRPDGSVQYAPGSLSMPSLTGDSTTETELLLIGGKKAGCVWFGRTRVPDAPEGAGTITLKGDGKALPLSSGGGCIKVPAKQTVTVVIQADAGGRASGTVRGTLEVFEQIDGAKAKSTTQIPFRFDMARGVDETRRLLLAVLLMIAGLGLPMLALLVINNLTARFQVLDVVRGTALPVLVADGTIKRFDGTRQHAFALREGDFDNLAETGNTRSFTFGGVVFRAKASRNPFGATIALAAPEGGAEKLKGNEGSRVELDPSLAGSWVFLLDSDKTRRLPRGEARGLLIAFVAEGDVVSQTSRMVPDITARLPETAARLSQLIHSAPAKASGKAHAPEPQVDPEGDTLPESDDTAVADDLDAPQAPAEADPEGGAEPPAQAQAPSAPTGFGGTTKAAVPPPAPAERSGDDDGPATPPAGFSGTRPGS